MEKLPAGLRFVEKAEEGDYAQVAALLNDFGLDDHDAATQRQIFTNSTGVEFIYQGATLIACGRVLSDRITQTAVYNIAVRRDFHDQHLGSALMRRILERYHGTTITLHTHPNTVAWYRRLGFHHLKTGMIIFSQPDSQWFQDEGFID
ncbi:MAG: GNAT family N-acetyltransferase [Lactobacillus sp.]|nr:GNAT family N-acetyltransferase [Lactobacillus sp.]MCI2032347.1 GNAT family N-acetyltransferase [Lactobacillus sp.]